MRNVRELYRLRIENLDFINRVIFNPNSKSAKGRRFIPMSDRALEILKTRAGERSEGWVSSRVTRANTLALRSQIGSG
jgi:integrase